jgi:hypothetical protein
MVLPGKGWFGMVHVYSRLALLACVVALGALALGAAPASVGASSGKLDATLTASTTGGVGWCCGHGVSFEGTGVVMRVGAVDFTGDWLGGCSFFTLPTPCFRRLNLVLTARNGDRLSIRGNDEWTQPFDSAPTTSTWSTDPAGSTGRFADFMASGTYTFVEAAPGGSGVTISLSGTT